MINVVGRGKGEKNWNDFLSYNEMVILILLACNPNEQDRLDLQRRDNEMSLLSRVIARRMLTEEHGFIEVINKQYRPTHAGIEFLHTYTQRKDICDIKNEVIISD